MWKPSVPTTARWRRLAVASNDRAVANARAAATEFSRLLVERAEVELYLAARSTVATVVPTAEGRPA